jgi:hypothetical protein
VIQWVKVCNTGHFYLYIQAGSLAIQQRWPRRPEIGATSDAKWMAGIVHRGQPHEIYTTPPRHARCAVGLANVGPDV